MATTAQNQDSTNFIPFLSFKAKFNTMMLSQIFTRKKDGSKFRKLGFWDKDGAYTECSFSSNLGLMTMEQIKAQRHSLMVADKTVKEAEVNQQTGEVTVKEHHYYTICGSTWEEVADNEGWD